ncbi:hypothetical protein X739_27440 [Mesorhizobium sp. LNHC220B00]|nr:hypothetical protein X739_27440 [Mesorhizobium sp. LNHC220B00]ESY94631.1 hypothetical protein X741_12235 [Mesorhizobium sp. LNHC229A00]ESY98045.1 hypothetical protein X738_17170 [Mesorhizobium sp. LNHC209A00]
MVVSQTARPTSAFHLIKPRGTLALPLAKGRTSLRLTAINRNR